MKHGAIILLLIMSFGMFSASARDAPDFDHYLLNLSWSPEFCYSHATSPECSAMPRHGFIVHGLWPEFRNGGGPEYCSHAAGLSNPASMLDIMPDLHLIEHEWQAHGTCSGLAPDDYFDLIRRAYNAIRIPRQFENPRAQVAISPSDIKKAFEQANPGLGDADIVIACDKRFLTAVSICLSKELKPVACPVARDCDARMIRVPPVR